MFTIVTGLECVWTLCAVKGEPIEHINNYAVWLGSRFEVFSAVGTIILSCLCPVRNASLTIEFIATAAFNYFMTDHILADLALEI